MKAINRFRQEASLIRHGLKEEYVVIADVYRYVLYDDVTVGKPYVAKLVSDNRSAWELVAALSPAAALKELKEWR